MAELKGIALYSASPSAAGQGSTMNIKVFHDAPLFCTIHVKQAVGGGADTLKVKIQGRAHSSLGWVDLKKQDMTTEASLAQVAGAVTENTFQCQLMPQMRVDISGTITGARAVSAHIVGSTTSARADS